MIPYRKLIEDKANIAQKRGIPFSIIQGRMSNEKQQQVKGYHFFLMASFLLLIYATDDLMRLDPKVSLVFIIPEELERGYWAQDAVEYLFTNNLVCR